MKQLYVATIEIALPIVASSPEEASELAYEHIKDEVYNISERDFYVRLAQNRVAYDNSWDPNTLPYGSDSDEETLEYWWAKNEAPRVE